VLVAGVVAVLVMVASPLRAGGWTRVPQVTTVSAADDPGIAAAQEAVDYWNRIFGELGTPFRLGAPMVVPGSVPAADMLKPSEQAQRWWWPTLPSSVERFPGDVLVVLSDADFVTPSVFRMTPTPRC
jgi:hypothetical protein